MILEELMAMIKHVNLSNFKFDIDFEDQCICWTTFFAMRLLPYWLQTERLLMAY